MLSSDEIKSRHSYNNDCVLTSNRKYIHNTKYKLSFFQVLHKGWRNSEW